MTPIGTKTGKEPRPASIKTQPVPATTLRESRLEADLNRFDMISTCEARSKAGQP